MKLTIILSTFIFAALPSFAHAQTTQPATTTASGPSAEQKMNQLLTPADTNKPLPPATTGPMADKTTGKGAVAPGATTMNTLREGTFIVNRIGHLSRSADGQQMEFSFDSDGKTMNDSPVIILPNLKLMQMENAIQGSSRDLRFRVSGMITEYKSRNYVLLDKVVVVPDIDQQF